MRKIFYSMALLAMTAACSLHSSDNGELDGFWQATAVDTIATGKSADVSNSQMSWSFQGDILHIRPCRNLGGLSEYICRFINTGDSLTVFDVLISDREVGDIAVTDSMSLSGTGLTHPYERFEILLLNEESMFLQSDSLRINFRKY